MTRIRLATVLALSCGIFALGPASALAARVKVHSDRYGLEQLYYVAARGEANHVVVSQPDVDVVDVSDRGAPVRAGGRCKSISRHRARCREFIDEIHVATRDRADTVRVGRGDPAVIVNSGSGNDRVRGGRGFDQIDGGAGRDLLDGGRGAGFDTVVYSSHRRAVTVQLGDHRTDGAPGEGDVLLHFENVRGGRGSDVLVGDGRPNTIEGGPGRDWMDGRGDSDELDGGGAADFARCGRGDDNVHPDGGDFVAPDCESLIFGDDNFMRPYPRVRRGVVRFVVPCPDPSTEGANVPCGGRISLRTGGGRLLGKARIKRHQYEELPVRVHLTRLGRRLAGRPLGVRARVLVNGLNLPRYRWQIRLRVPR
ncbi:MAG: hypothetical protein ACJ766_12795 [Thermoleophilaceae bacterium]